MSVAIAISLKSRITRIVWALNAMNGAFLTLLGGVMILNVVGFDAQLAPLMARVGGMFAFSGATLGVFSAWRARSLSATR